MKLSVIICSYNEKNTILEVVRRVRQVDLGNEWTKEIIIVDNNSTDGTRSLLQNIMDTNVQVVLQPKNLGKGASIRTAIPLCTGDYTIIQDADLEYHPRQFPLFLKKALDEDLDAVYGSRVLGDKRYYHYLMNYWAVLALSVLTNILFGSRFTDVATANKMVRTSVLQSLKLTCSSFDLDFELTNKLALATKKIGEVPIYYEPRTYKEGKKITFKDGLEALWVIFRDKFSS